MFVTIIPLHKPKTQEEVLRERVRYILELNGGEMTYGDLLKEMKRRGWVVD